MNFLWIPVTIAAAFFQNLRSSLQRHLKGKLSDMGATYVRFAFAWPFAVMWLALFANQWTRIDREIAGARQSVAASAETAYIAPVTVLRMMSLGHQSFLADLLFVRVAHYFVEHLITDSQMPWIDLYLDAIWGLEMTDSTRAARAERLFVRAACLYEAGDPGQALVLLDLCNDLGHRGDLDPQVFPLRAKALEAIGRPADAAVAWLARSRGAADLGVQEQSLKEAARLALAADAQLAMDLIYARGVELGLEDSLRGLRFEARARLGPAPAASSRPPQHQRAHSTTGDHPGRRWHQWPPSDPPDPRSIGRAVRCGKQCCWSRCRPCAPAE